MTKTKFYLISIVKCIIITLIITVVSIMIFALILKVFSLDNVVIKPINYLIKTLSVFIGCLFSVKGYKGALKGLILGGISTVVCYFFFCFLSGNIIITSTLIWDILLGLVVGSIGGIAGVNLKK